MPENSLTLMPLRDENYDDFPCVWADLRDSLIAHRMQWKYVTSDVVGLLRLGPKKGQTTIPHSEGNQLPRSPASLTQPQWRGHVWALWSTAPAELPVDSQHQPPALWVSHLGHPASSDLRWLQLTPTSYCNCMRTPSENCPASPMFLTRKSVSKIKKWLCYRCC